MSLAFYSWAPVTGRRVLHNGEELSPEETGLDFFLLCSGEFPVLLSFATVNSRLRLLCICLSLSLIHFPEIQELHAWVSSAQTWNS